jgi:nitrite reductase/ring-hydroxylating ferredoxin subunit
MSQWITIASVDQAREGDVVGLSVQGRALALYRIEDALYVTDDGCTHGQARLSEGFVIDHCVECPLHQGQFDIRTGAPLCAPVTEPIRVYPVRVLDGSVQIALEAPTPAL